MFCEQNTQQAREDYESGRRMPEKKCRCCFNEVAEDHDTLCEAHALESAWDAIMPRSREEAAILVVGICCHALKAYGVEATPTPFDREFFRQIYADQSLPFSLRMD
ncbi:MAG: hypothetical protein WAN65_17495 [Candidatus Sulfotelmatobacter sp.]